MNSRILNRVLCFHLYILLFFAFNSFSLQAGTPNDSTPGALRLSANFHYGFVMAHRPILIPLQQEHVTGLDIQVARATTGIHDWEKIYFYPSIGINYSYFNLGDLEHLGHGHALFPFILFPLTKRPGLQLHVRFGVGVGYADKVFDRKENYKNQALGTHFNAIFAVHSFTVLKLTRRLFMQSALGVTHFSNGSIDIPNLGINIISVSGGFNYYLGRPKPLNREPYAFPVKKWRGSLMISGAVKKVYPPGGPRYLAGSLSLVESVRVKKKSAFGAALDLFYDNSIHARLLEDSITYRGPADQLRVGVAGSYELIVSDLSFLLQVGGYLRSKVKSDGTIYSRFGIRYAVSKRFFLNFNLKTHFAKADFFEWGGGWLF